MTKVMHGMKVKIIQCTLDYKIPVNNFYRLGFREQIRLQELRDLEDEDSDVESDENFEDEEEEPLFVEEIVDELENLEIEEVEPEELPVEDLGFEIPDPHYNFPLGKYFISDDAYLFI